MQLTDEISTEKAAQRVVRTINKIDDKSRYKTFFLDGKWGSGKTEFLKNVENQAEFSIYPRENFVYVRLWEGTDSRSVMEIVFAKLFPGTYLSLKVLVVISVVTAVLMTPAINIGGTGFLSDVLGNNIYSWLTVKFISILALSALVWQFLKFKSDWFYRLMLRKGFTFSKVLVVDDFDRVDDDLQADAYKVFHTINGRLPIIFVGDSKKILHGRSNYIRKIIDETMLLPLQLQAAEIWPEYLTKLGEAAQFKFDYNIQQLLILEDRTLRDRDQLDYYLQREFFNLEKIGRVQLNQQFIIIYLFLFYPEFYKQIRLTRNAEEIKVTNDHLKEVNADSEVMSDDACQIIIKILNAGSDAAYPKFFKYRPSSYLVSENIQVMSWSEGFDILKSDDAFQAELEKSPADLNYDFVDFYISLQDVPEPHIEAALLAAKQLKSNRLISYIIDEESKSIRRNNPDGSDEFNVWKTKLTTLGFDISEQILLLVTFGPYSYYDLDSLFEELSLAPEKLKNLKRKSFYLLLYISQRQIWEKFDYWPEELINAVNELTEPDDFIIFWQGQGLIKVSVPILMAHDQLNTLGQRNFEVRQNRYTLDTHSENESWPTAVELFKNKQPELEKMDYSFTFVDDENLVKHNRRKH